MEKVYGLPNGPSTAVSLRQLGLQARLGDVEAYDPKEGRWTPFAANTGRGGVDNSLGDVVWGLEIGRVLRFRGLGQNWESMIQRRAVHCRAANAVRVAGRACCCCWLHRPYHNQNCFCCFCCRLRGHIVVYVPWVMLQVLTQWTLQAL